MLNLAHLGGLLGHPPEIGLRQHESSADQILGHHKTILRSSRRICEFRLLPERIKRCRPPRGSPKIFDGAPDRSKRGVYKVARSVHLYACPTTSSPGAVRDPVERLVGQSRGDSVPRPLRLIDSHQSKGFLLFHRLSCQRLNASVSKGLSSRQRLGFICSGSCEAWEGVFWVTFPSTVE